MSTVLSCVIDPAIIQAEQLLQVGVGLAADRATGNPELAPWTPMVYSLSPDRPLVMPDQSIVPSDVRLSTGDNAMHTISRATTDFAGVALYGISDPRTAKQYPNSMARLSVQRHGIASLFASLTEATKKSAYFGCDVYICNYTNGRTISLYGQSETCCPFKVVLDPAREFQDSGSHVKIGHLIELPPADRSDIRVWLKPERSTGNKPNKSGSSTSGSGSSVRGWSKVNPLNWPQMYRDTNFKRLMGLSTANPKENDEAERIMDRAMKEATDDEEFSRVMLAAGAFGALIVSGLALYAWRQRKATNNAADAPADGGVAAGAAGAPAGGGVAAGAAAKEGGFGASLERGRDFLLGLKPGAAATPPEDAGGVAAGAAATPPGGAAPRVFTGSVRGAALEIFKAFEKSEVLSGLKPAATIKDGKVVFGSLAGATLLFTALRKTNQPLGASVIASVLGALVAGMATKEVNARGLLGAWNNFRSAKEEAGGEGGDEDGRAAADDPKANAAIAEELQANIRAGERDPGDLGRLREQHSANAALGEAVAPVGADDDAVKVVLDEAAAAASPSADGAGAATPPPGAAAAASASAQASMADASPERVKRAGADDTGSGFSKKGVNTKRAKKGR